MARATASSCNHACASNEARPCAGLLVLGDSVHIDKNLRDDIVRTATRVLQEDIGTGDVTADLIDAEAMVTAVIVSRDGMTMAGKPWVDEVFRQLDDRVRIDWFASDGDSVAPDTPLCELKGPARAVLSGERGALNFLQTLSATATTTASYVAAVAGTGCRILDTRKTLPGLRLAQKYAVRCGGGTNHRVGLFDALLIKENHIASAGGIAAALDAARQLHADKPVEIEVESIDELREALSARPDRILLDNFSTDALVDAVRINERLGTARSELEASGNLTLKTIRDVAQTGVDFISVGALTKNVAAVDLSMRVGSFSMPG